MEPPAPRRPFSQLYLIAQQLRSLGPLLGRAAQVESVFMSISLSRSGPVGEASPGNFNFGVGKGGGC